MAFIRNIYIILLLCGFSSIVEMNDDTERNLNSPKKKVRGRGYGADCCDYISLKERRDALGNSLPVADHVLYTDPCSKDRYACSENKLCDCVETSDGVIKSWDINSKACRTIAGQPCEASEFYNECFKGVSCINEVCTCPRNKIRDSKGKKKDSQSNFKCVTKKEILQSEELCTGNKPRLGLKDPLEDYAEEMGRYAKRNHKEDSDNESQENSGDHHESVHGHEENSTRRQIANSLLLVLCFYSALKFS